MSTSYEMTGTVKVIMEKMTFPSGFTKQEFVITTEEERFPQPIKFSVLKERCALLDLLKPNDRVCVHFDIRGNLSTKNGERYFVDLQVFQIDKLDGDGSSIAPEPVSRDYDDSDDGDAALPF